MRSRFKLKRMAHLATLALTGAAGADWANAQAYTITVIPSLDPTNGGTAIYPLAINSSGTITGYYQDVQEAPAFDLVDLGFVAQVTGNTVTEQSLNYIGGNIPPTDPSPPAGQSWGFSINGYGVVTGTSPDRDGNSPVYSVTEYSGALLSSLGTLPQAGATLPQDAALAFGASINSNGVIAGASWEYSQATLNRLHAFVYNPSTGYTDLSQGLMNTSAAYSLNPAGTVAVGFISTGTTKAGNGTPNTPLVAEKWTLTGGAWNPTSLGTLGGSQSIAYGVNAAGQIVGVADTSGDGSDAFVYQNGQMIDLNGTPSTGSGTFGDPVYVAGGLNGFTGNPLNAGVGTVNSLADAINDNGQIVGYTTQSGTMEAFIATVNSNNVVTMTNISQMFPGYFINEATGINDLGQVVAYGTYTSGRYSGNVVGLEINTAPIGTWNSSAGGSWATASNWTGNIPNAVGVVANFGTSPGLAASGDVTLDGNQTVGHIVFNNNTSSYTINSGSGGSLIIDDSTDVAGPTPSITVSAGSHAINAPIILATNNGSIGVVVNTWTGTSLTLGGSIAAMNGGSGVLTADGGGQLLFALTAVVSVPLVVNNSVTFQAKTSGTAGILVRVVPSINISSGTSTVAIAPAVTPSSRQLLVTTPILSTGIPQYGSVSQWMGTLDLANNDMDIPNGNLATISSMVAQGFSAFAIDLNVYPEKNVYGYYSGDPGAFVGAYAGIGGIVSSSAALDTTHLTALGVIENVNAAGKSLYSTFDGHSVTSTDVLVKYTYYGDANDDGMVDGSDYSRIDNGYLKHLTGWGNGDFNYDGIVDGSDYTLIDNAFNTQGASLASTPDAALTDQIAVSEPVSVPEPTTLGIITLCTLSWLSRRRSAQPVARR
jgi:probable HAF family extracellular repeat protein